MRLKKGFVCHQVGGEHMAVAAGEAADVFHGLIRNNETADVIYRMLLRETTQQEITEALYEQYDAPKEVISQDVERFLAQLREAGFLDE